MNSLDPGDPVPAKAGNRVTTFFESIKVDLPFLLKWRTCELPGKDGSLGCIWEMEEKKLVKGGVLHTQT
jgi:hypothetical protein